MFVYILYISSTNPHCNCLLFCRAWNNCSANVQRTGCTFRDLFIQVLQKPHWSLYNAYNLTQQRYKEGIDSLHHLCSNIVPGNTVSNDYSEVISVVLYINDIYNAVPGINVKLFADDTNLFLPGKYLVDFYSKANASLEELFKWFVVNRRSLNIDKTCYSMFDVKLLENINLELKINDKKIRMVESCKYLGIFIDRSCLGKST